MTAQTTQTNAAQIESVDIGNALGLNGYNGRTIDLPTSFKQSPYLAARTPGYQFRDNELRELLGFLIYPFGDALYISGPTGSGKTSLVTEVCARLGWPVQSVTAHGRMELTDLIGFTVPVVREGVASMEFQYGPLATAMKEGHILLINELDLMDPAELAGMNDILEGRPLVIAQNGGEVIKPKPTFRVIVTANSNGAGDDTGLYQGVLQQNLAAMDRYRMLEVDYAETDVELAILAKAAAATSHLHSGMVEVANLIRDAFKGDPSSSVEATLSVTMSTRTLIRWAMTSLLYGGPSCPNPLEKGLEASLLRRGTAEDREVILRFAKDVFGDEWGSAS